MLKDERQGKFKLTILQHDDNDDAFYEALGGKPDSIREIDDSIGWSPILYRYSFYLITTFIFEYYII